MVKTLNRVRYWVYNRKNLTITAHFLHMMMITCDPDNYTLPNKRERSVLCQSTGTSPFEPHTLWQASLNCASLSRPTRGSGTVWFQWQSPALVDYFWCQLHRLCDPKDELPCSHLTGAIPASLHMFCSRAPASTHTRPFPAISHAKRLEFSRDSVTMWGLDNTRYLCLYWKNTLSLLTKKGRALWHVHWIGDPSKGQHAVANAFFFFAFLSLRTVLVTSRQQLWPAGNKYRVMHLGVSKPWY